MRTNHHFGLDNDFLTTFNPTGVRAFLYLHVIEEVFNCVLLKMGHVRAMSIVTPGALDFLWFVRRCVADRGFRHAALLRSRPFQQRRSEGQS
jgi:hypothetical protein